ncbi:MAG TPA: hypothetical protein VIK58_17225, partial [Caldimonas sp.]
MVAGAAASGCGLNQAGIEPPSDRIFYPGAIGVDSTGRFLYVINSNADLRFNDGTAVAIRLGIEDAPDAQGTGVSDVRESARPAGGGAPQKPREICPDSKFVNPVSGPPDFCCWDTLDHNILNCDERQFMVPGASVMVGSFGSALQLQRLQDGTINQPAHRQRLLAAVRGNASVTWIDATVSDDLSGVSFACRDGAPDGAFVECDLDHRVSEQDTAHGQATVLQDPVLLPEEPYALAIDESQQLLYVGHLRGGLLSAVNLATTPSLIGAFSSIFPGDVNGS